MAATSAVNISIGSTASTFSKAGPNQSKAFSAKLNPKPHLRSFSGLKAVSSGSDSSFLSNEKNNHSHNAKAQRKSSSITPHASYKVAVLGAGGGIGQPLSLLVKMSPLVSALNLYDVANV